TGANAAAIRIAQATTGAALAPDTSAFGDYYYDQCPTSSIVGSGNTAMFDSSACPAQAKVGTATLSSPQLGSSMQGEIYMISRAPIPNFGIKAVGGSGLNFVVTSSVVNFDPACDPLLAACDASVQLTTSNMPNVGDSTVSLTFDGPDRAGYGGVVLNGKIFKLAQAEDSVCDGSLNSRGTMLPWLTGTAVTDTDSDPIDCVPPGGDTMSPVVTITSPIDNAVTSGSSIAVTYTVTDNLDPTPTCDKANGSSQPLTAGTNTITVTCVDDAGNSGSDSVTVIRTTPTPSPDPNCAISGTTLTCTWTQPADVTPTCQLDMGPATTCTPPVTYAGLSSGPHTFTLCFTDIYGNVSCATYSFTIVIEPAAITSYANPSAGTPASGPASPAPIVTFGNENPAYYECRVDAGAWSSCSSPWTIPTTGLTSPAEHSYEIRTPGGTLGTGYFWYDNRTFNATATATAVPNSLEPTAADANDAGAHPNITATLSLEGYDDPKSASVIGPDGLMGSLRSIPENSRCTVTQADAGTCPASSLIGTAVGTGVSATDGTVTANGNIYLVDAAGLPSTDAAGVALEFENITGPIHGNLGNVIVRGSLRINDQARNIRLVANDIPRQTSNGVRVHMLNGSITINGDTRPDMSAPPSETNPPLITNQHRCTTPGTHRPNFNKFVGTGTGYNGSVIPTVTATYAVDNCAAVPFNPTIGYSLTSVEPGTGTVMTADMSLPFDHSPTAAIQVTLPPFLSANTAAFGDTSVDQCPVETIVNASPVSTPVYNYFDYDNPSFPCPPQARVGEATITTPLLDGTVTGTVWLIEKAPIPNIGIVIDADTPGNPQGVNIGLVGTTATVQYVPTCDPLFETCDQSIRAVFNAMPDVPLSTVQLKMGTVPGRVDGLGNPLQQHVVKIAAEADSVCHPDEIRTTLVAMRGTPNVSRAQMLTPNCGLPTNEPPQLSFISLPSYTNQSPVTVNYTATDDSGTTPTCNPASGFTFPLVEGLNTVSVTCTDNEGASSTWTRSVRLDTQPPTINFMQCGSSPTAQSSCTLSFGVTDNNPLGSSPCQPVNGTNQPLTIGTNTITVTCSDQAGNSASGSVAIERVALPTVSLSCTPGASSADCTFSATGGIPPYTFTCQIDSEPASACSSPSSISLTPGPHLVVVCVTDSEGNVACNSVSVVIGPSGLETSIVNATPPSTRSTDPMNVTFVTSPNGSTAECRVDSGAWSTCTAPWTVPLSGFTTPGEHSFEVRAVFGSTVDESPEKRFVWVDDRAFNAVPTVTAVPNSLEPTAADANDAGAHPNITATLSLEGYDDPKSANVIGPDGLMGSLRSIPENSRCSMAQADAGTCPPSSLIGTATATATTTTDGAVTANGNIYLVDAAGLPASDAAGVAVEFENITGPVNGDLGNVVARGGLRINDQARNLRAVIDDIPRQTSGGVRFHLRSGSLTINGDTRPDMGAPPSETNPPLITNQHICASPGASRPNFNKFVGTGKGYDGSTTPTITATYAVDNCAALPFSPTINYEFSDLTAGAGTELKVTASVPYDHSTLRAVQVVLPPFAAANTAAFGDASMDQCPVEAIVNASPPSTPTYNYFDYENPSYPCPAQARVGSATITSPLLESPITGTVWLIEKAPIPNIGVAIDADAPGNPQGVNIGLIGTTATVSYVATCDPLLETCDQAIQSTFASLPDVPLSTMVMELGTVPGRVDSLGNPLQQHMIKIAAAADSVCRNAGDNVRTLLVPWRGTPNASRTQLTQPTGCLQ
ncbi:MAG: hypothetical protein HZB14_02520, partial [Actinobacteria bacterium]|nr:hypothetical protein [Actinomycetota bacterium]